MTDSSKKPTFSRRTGLVHGVRAFIDSNKLPSGREYRRSMKRVDAIRDSIVAKYGGPEKIAPDVLVLVNSAAQSMMVQELCTIYIKKSGILRRDSLDHGNLEMHSVLAKSYVAYANLTRLSLEAAARLAGIKVEQATPDILTYIQAYDAQKDAQEAQEGPVRRCTCPQGAQDGPNGAGEPDTTGPEGDEPSDDDLPAEVEALKRKLAELKVAKKCRGGERPRRIDGDGRSRAADAQDQGPEEGDHERE